MPTARKIESRWRYARGTLRRTLTSAVEAWITTGLAGIGGTATGLVLSHGHSIGAQVVVTVLTGIGGLVAGCCLVLGGLWFVAPSKQRDSLYDELAAVRANNEETVGRLRNEVETLRGVAPRPDFLEGRVEPAQPMIDGSTQTFAFGRVTNTKSLPDRGEVARRAILTLCFFRPNGNLIYGPISGRWRDAPSPTSLPATQLHTHTEAIDLEPNGAIREFDLGTKRLEDVAFVAIDAAQHPHPLDEMRVRVEVRLSGNNFPDIVGSYLVESLGVGNIMRATLEGVRHQP